MSHLNPIAVFNLVAQSAGVFFAIGDIRSGVNDFRTFSIGNQVYLCFGKVLKKWTKGENARHMLYESLSSIDCTIKILCTLGYTDSSD